MGQGWHWPHFIHSSLHPPLQPLQKLLRHHLNLSVWYFWRQTGAAFKLCTPANPGLLDNEWKFEIQQVNYYIIHGLIEMTFPENLRPVLPLYFPLISTITSDFSKLTYITQANQDSERATEKNGTCSCSTKCANSNYKYSRSCWVSDARHLSSKHRANSMFSNFMIQYFRFRLNDMPPQHMILTP